MYEMTMVAGSVVLDGHSVYGLPTISSAFSRSEGFAGVIKYLCAKRHWSGILVLKVSVCGKEMRDMEGCGQSMLKCK